MIIAEERVSVDHGVREVGVSMDHEDVEGVVITSQGDREN